MTMSKTSHTISISKEAREQTDQMVADAFRQMNQHSLRMAKDIAEYRRKREEVKKRIDNGARRTSGHIV